MTVRLRKGARPGKVLGLGESTPSLDAIRASLPELGTVERCEAASRMVHKHVWQPGWDPVLYDLQSVREEAYIACYGVKDWFREAATNGY